jgi:carboxylesterase type B
MLGPALQDSETITQPGGFQEMYDNVTMTVGCASATDTLACLRRVPYESLFAAFAPQVYTPVIDGTFLSRRPSESLARGLVADVAVLVGANTDEGTASFWGPRGTLNTSADVAAYIRTLNGGGLNNQQVDDLLRLYPDDPVQGCPYGTGEERFASQGWMYKRGAAIAGDIFVHAGRRRVAEFFAARRTGKPTYSYRFDQAPWNGVEELIATVAPVYSTHYVEVSIHAKWKPEKSTLHKRILTGGCVGIVDIRVQQPISQSDQLHWTLHLLPRSIDFDVSLVGLVRA